MQLRRFFPSVVKTPKRSIVLALIFFLYPLFVFLGFTYLSLELTNLFLFLFLLFRVLVQKRNGPFEKAMFAAALIMSIVSFLGLLFERAEVVKLYPVIINFVLALFFILSLRTNKTPVIEKIASLYEKLDKKGIEYTRRVTIIWLLFFIINGLVSLWTFFYASLEVWTFYNAFLSYILIGLLFFIEFLVRRHIKTKGVLS